MEYDLSKDEMLDILVELAQGEHIWRNSKDDLLNFIEEIRESSLNADSSVFGALSPLLEKGKKEEKK